jgi:uncharacterized RDD family membrane protein YckC
VSRPQGTDPANAVSMQGHYAGAATRLAAFALDQAILTGSFAGMSAVVAWILSLVIAEDLNWDPGAVVTGLLLLLWWFLYYSYPWAMSGKTPGMALLGIRVVRADGSPARAGNAVRRTLALPLSFLTLGIGFLPIVFGKERRALHDKLAGTAVVYSWDARAARWRFLARQQESDPASA